MPKDKRKKPPPFYPFHSMWEGARIPFEDWHFHRRLYERYGIVLRPGEYGHLLKKVRNKAGIYYHSKDGVRVHRIYLHGAMEDVFVVANDSTLITAIDPMQAVKTKARLAKKADASAEG